MIKEIIVVEGKNDLRAVKNAVEAEVITTSGYGLNNEIINRIKIAQERQGVIILTDPDTVGERIRKKLNQLIPGCKNAFLSRRDGEKDGDVGIENASPEAIRAALLKGRAEITSAEPQFAKADLILTELIGGADSAARRAAMGETLGIGYTNGKQFLNRLNSYAITREEFIRALEKIEG